MESSLLRPRRHRRGALKRQPMAPCLGGNPLPPRGARAPAKPADIVAVTRDISERKAHEAALIEARDDGRKRQPRQDRASSPI